MSVGADVQTISLRISGRVQMVGYRRWVIDKAEGLGLNGWVRNVADGSVEILANGYRDKVDQLVELCRIGTPASCIDDISIVVVDPPGEGGGFPTKGFQQLVNFNPEDVPVRS